MSKQGKVKVLATGVKYLDRLMGGGLTECSISVIGGAPGSGKTILVQQIGFHHASTGGKVLFIQTLSEPTIKTLLYLQQFDYFRADELHSRAQFIDLGMILKTKGLVPAAEMIMEHVQREKPTMVIIDSFRVFDDIANSRDDMRRFSYELAVNMTAWECTTILLGEFGPKDFETNPLFSVIDALIMVTQEEVSGEQQRYMQIVKMRGADHDRNKHPFIINDTGIELFTPGKLICHDPAAEALASASPRLKTGIQVIDELLGEGIPRGTTTLMSGVAGTGKTTALLEFIYRGAKEKQEKGLFVSFEQSSERLVESANQMGWDLAGELKRGMVEILYIPPPDIILECELGRIQERLASGGFIRIAIDSLSRFFHKIDQPLVVREKLYHLVTLLQNVGSVGLFSTEIPPGTNQFSWFGIEETMVDGLILLTIEKKAHRRQRYLEVYKFRQTAHALGQFPFAIAKDGLKKSTEER